jgi:MSHA biogenesis protein MshP
MKRKGQVLVAAIFVLVIIAFLGLIVAQMLSTEGYSAVKNLHGIQALNVAEGGVRFTIATQLATDSNWADNNDFGPITLGPGSFMVHYVTKLTKSATVEVTGTVQGVSRTIRTGCKAGGGNGVGDQWNNYVGYGGSGLSSGHELLFNNNARCYGNLYYYGPVRFANNAQQTGGVIYSLSITPASPGGIPGSYASWEAISGTYETPGFDPTYYNNWLASANVSTSNVLNMSSGTLDLAGGTRYYRYINITGGTVLGPGTMCATANPSGGSINIGGSATINGFVRFIARGNASNPIIFAPNTGNTVFTSNIEVIGNSYIYIQDNTLITRESIIYVAGNDGKYGVQVQDSAQIRGSTVIAPVGVIRLMNNSTMEGRLWAESIWSQDYSDYFGTAWVFLDIIGGSQIKDWSVLTQQADGMPSSLAPGLDPGLHATSGSFEVSGWGEVFY